LFGRAGRFGPRDFNFYNELFLEREKRRIFLERLFGSCVFENRSSGDENVFSPSLSVHKTRDVTDDDEDDDDDDADEQQQQSALVLVHVHIEIESVDPQKSYHCNQYEEKETDDEEEDRSCCQRR
jgi:hypothetical protein